MRLIPLFWDHKWHLMPDDGHFSPEALRTLVVEVFFG